MGILLCLLVVLFAFEAKSAWYGPVNVSTLQISTSKMQVTDAPQLVARAFASSQPAQSGASLLLFPFLALFVAAVACGWIVEDLQASILPIKFFRHLFCRPPPLS